MTIHKYDTYSDDEFSQMRVKLKAYADRLDKGETIGERGGVLEFFRLYNTVVVQQMDLGYEAIPESNCGSCTKRLKRNIDNYFTFYPIINIPIEDESNTNSTDGEQSNTDAAKPGKRSYRKKDKEL